ncbi:MAG TPA: tRNA pseudouridine(38-40) synthase TruA [Candidatus Binataceae bacterium]|jgi:tRNA pseudouridine38-40 synthase|nr:tRNA pseudouridine(38-40) synthase TruA [Candidatus Binataceae bacterium]
MRVRLTIEYDGTGYCGWQSQAGDDTVQARIEAVLEKIFGQSLRIHAAGRTDAGVHALGQVAAFDAPRYFDPLELRRALNALLPHDIVVREAAEAAPGFDARRDARVRVYEYRIHNRALRPVFDYRYAWHIPQPLNFAAMRSAARFFLGEHDFAAFRTLGTETRSTVREIYLSQWEKRGDILFYRIEGSSFLRHMVRSMVAAMVEVGRNRLDGPALGALLASGNRAAAPAAAPARGLFLVEVRYPKGSEGRP